MKKLRTLSIVFLLPMILPAFAGTPDPEEESFSITTMHKMVWDQAIAQVIELADAMPEEKYSFRPHDSVRTFAEQLVHIGGASKVIANLYLNDVPPPQEAPKMEIDKMSKEEIKTMVKSLLEEVGQMISATSDKKLQEEITSFGGNKMTRLEGMLTVHDHLTNHKAKANLYVRISGHQPPSYRYY